MSDRKPYWPDYQEIAATVGDVKELIKPSFPDFIYSIVQYDPNQKYILLQESRPHPPYNSRSTSFIEYALLHSPDDQVQARRERQFHVDHDNALLKLVDANAAFISGNLSTEYRLEFKPPQPDGIILPRGGPRLNITYHTGQRFSPSLAHANFDGINLSSVSMDPLDNLEEVKQYKEEVLKQDPNQSGNGLIETINLKSANFLLDPEKILAEKVDFDILLHNNETGGFDFLNWGETKSPEGSSASFAAIKGEGFNRFVRRTDTIIDDLFITNPIDINKFASSLVGKLDEWTNIPHLISFKMNRIRQKI